MTLKGLRGPSDRGLPLTSAAGPGGARLLTRVLALALLCLAAFTVVEVAGLARWGLGLKRAGPCQADNEGSWSIGIFKGRSPLELQPLERYEPRQDSSAAWPVANPVLTCASVGDAPSNFVADPFLLQRDGQLYLFYETKGAASGRGQIGVAVSGDGGVTFRHLAVVLDAPWHLSYPFVFEHEGQVYLMPEASKSGRLTLYRAAAFPTAWEEDRVALRRPLVDASLVEWQGRWYLLGSDHSRRGATPHGELEVWHSESPLGPWEPHALNPVARGGRASGFRNGGRLVAHDGRLLRFGQDCGATYGHQLVAFEVTKLSPTEFEQRRVPHNISGLAGHRRPSWISARHHHIDVQQLPSGEWIAAIDGDSVPSGPLSQRVIRTALRVGLPWALVAAAWLAFSVGLVRSRGFRRWAVGSGLAITSPLAPTKEARNGSSSSSSSSSSVALLARRLQFDLQQCSKGLEYWASWVQSLRRRCLPSGACQGLALAAVLAAALGAAAVYAFVAPYRQPAAPVAVAGHYSQFTLVSMSYEARMSTLRPFVRHYSRCPSVAEIVLVWNKGAPPVPERDFDSAVPMRVRVEPLNSLNNRFRQDPLIRTRAVLSLDDDIMLPCADLERAFARWRASPTTMLGFFPRLIEGEPRPEFRGEWYVVEQGRYNVVLTGAAFLDTQTALPAYWADAVRPARDTVDRVFNGEDLLMNFVLANASAAAGPGAPPAVEFVRPTRRVDISKLSGVGISHTWAKFLDATQEYLTSFTQTFGGVPLQTHTITWAPSRPPFFCSMRSIGCTYM